MMHQLHYILEYINKDRVSIDPWINMRIYSETDLVYFIQASQDVIGLERKKSIILKKSELLQFIRDEKLKKLGL